MPRPGWFLSPQARQPGLARGIKITLSTGVFVGSLIGW
jgi:hypothetical protein